MSPAKLTREQLDDRYEAAIDALDEWDRAHPEPKYKYELRYGTDKLGRSGGWFVRRPEYDGWLRARAPLIARIDRYWLRLHRHPEVIAEYEEWRRRLRERYGR